MTQLRTRKPSMLELSSDARVEMMSIVFTELRSLLCSRSLGLQAKLVVTFDDDV